MTWVLYRNSRHFQHLLETFCGGITNTREFNERPKFLLALDFEATCEKQKKITQEIIEFPCIKISTSTFVEEARFHKYIRPEINKQLPEFCTDLTGIIQEMVENEKNFKETLVEFEKWREVEKLSVDNSLYVTSGDWDLGKMLPTQCELLNIPVPDHMMQWIDLKKLFGATIGNFPRSLRDMVQTLDMQFYGHQHSGIDDCINIAHILKELLMRGALLQPTARLARVGSTWKVTAL